MGDLEILSEAYAKSKLLQATIIPIIDQIALVHLRRAFSGEREDENKRALEMLAGQLDKILGLKM